MPRKEKFEKYGLKTKTTTIRIPDLNDLEKDKNMRKAIDEFILDYLNLKEKVSIKKSEINFKDMTITQDDLWNLYKFKTGKGTRDSRSKLLSKFTEVFNKNLEKLKEKKGVDK
ncbi:hypothetical protein LCGC14_1110470 [marine sediment metagenome]|uniref:Uncharacterized protein n=1 Tax=marine sediment metagenome TaxID=412755 RepID=A0A0F9MBL3_9ZZZZ|nr:hypothetical protein [archaeon]HEC40661.1 hypothetical protein [bacterium]